MRFGICGTRTHRIPASSCNKHRRGMRSVNCKNKNPKVLFFYVSTNRKPGIFIWSITKFPSFPVIITWCCRIPVCLRSTYTKPHREHRDHDIVGTVFPVCLNKPRMKLYRSIDPYLQTYITLVIIEYTAYFFFWTCNLYNCTFYIVFPF